MTAPRNLATIVDDTIARYDSAVDSLEHSTHQAGDCRHCFPQLFTGHRVISVRTPRFGLEVTRGPLQLAVHLLRSGRHGASLSSVVDTPKVGRGGGRGAAAAPGGAR